MARTLIKEIEGDDPDAQHIERAIATLRDEITVYMMSMYRGNNRELALIVTKLDEAEQWAVRHAMNAGRLVTVDRAELLKAAHSV